MTTVPKTGDPPPPNNAKTLTIGDGSGMYVRPTAGGNASGDAGEAPSGAIPDSGSAYAIPSLMGGGAPVGANGTQAGPDMGSGATQVIPDSGDRPSGYDNDSSSGGTVGDSGPQPAGPSMPRTDFPKSPDLP